MKKVIVLFVLMIVSFSLSAMFFFNSGYFSFQKGEVSEDKINEFSLALDEFLSSKFEIEGARDINKTLKSSIRNIENIEINVVSSNIYIERVDDAEASFQLIGYGREDLSLVNRDNELKIEVEYPNINSFFDIRYKNTNLYVKIPRDYEMDIEINSISADVEISDFTLKKLDIDTTSGDVKMSKLKSDKIVIDSISGTVTVKESSLPNIYQVSGDSNLEGVTQNSDIKMNSISGDIEVYYAEDQSVRINFDSVSGIYDGPDKLGNGKYSLDVDTTSGDLVIV